MKINFPFILKTKDYEEPIISHIQELKKKILLIFFSIFFCFMVLYPFSTKIVSYILHIIFFDKINLFVYSPISIVYTKIKTIFFISILFNILFIIYEIFDFISRGLENKEYNFVLKILPYSIFLYLFSLCFSFKLFLPLFFKYILLYSNNIAIPKIDFMTIINTIYTIIIWICILFQIPLFIIFMLKVKLIKKEKIQKLKYTIYFFIFSISLLITPDITFISQFFIVIIFIILFEISLIIEKYI